MQLSTFCPPRICCSHHDIGLTMLYRFKGVLWMMTDGVQIAIRNVFQNWNENLWPLAPRHIFLKCHQFIECSLKKRWTLIANKVKINVCLFSIKLLIVRTILCATVQTYTTITTAIIACPLFFSVYNLFYKQFAILLTPFA